ncbi:phage holin family protein [Bdellovibrio bacteriovorus]|uniref:phage holin family protein n=1 Tax=Bdellovibrio bacteriovorus TaxID=959 RepID=UPI0035A73706
MEMLKSLALTGLLVFAPIKAVIITVGVLIFADMILGIMAARKRGEAITSAGMRRSVTKMFVYQSAVMTGFLVETFLLGGLIPVNKLVGGVIGVVEFKSLLENVTEITGTDFKEIIRKLGSKNDE